MLHYPKIAQLKSVEALRDRLAELHLDLPVDGHVLTAEGGSPLAAPLQVGPHRVGNRWVIHPMEGWDANRDGSPSPHTLRRWRNFGLSGAKLIWGGEAAAVQPDGRANPNQTMAIAANRDGLQALIDTLLEAHREFNDSTDDLLVGLQLTHSGRFCRPNNKKLEPRIAYHHPLLDAKFGIDPEDSAVVWTDDDLLRLIDRYVEAARLARDVGFQFVDIKACHGYLLHEFLSARTRMGPFGGDLQGRTRLLRTIIERVRDEVPQLSVLVRLSVFDTLPYEPGSAVGQPMAWRGDDYPHGFGVNPKAPAEIDLSEPIALLRNLQQLGVLAVNISCGSPYYNPHVQRPAIFPPSDGYAPPEDPLVGVVRQIQAARTCREALPALPMVGTGYSYLQDYLPHVAQAVVRAGWIDMVGLGRMVLSYPELPRDVLRHGRWQRKKVCRTFSDCTTAPRKGLISGCYPLDPYYKALEQAETLKQIKSATQYSAELAMNPSLQPQPTAVHSLLPLRGNLLRDAGIDRSLQAVAQGSQAVLDGIWGSSAALAAAALAERCDPRPVVVVCPQAGLIDDVMDDLRLFTDRSMVSFPALEERPNRLLHDENYGERLRTLKQLLHHEPIAFVVTAIQAIMQPVPDRQRLAGTSRWLRAAETLDTEALAGWLTQNGYHATSAVELPGEFSLRGGILDIFATDWDQPVRVELFGDQIESLRRFDVASQRSLESLQQVELTVLAQGSEGRACLTEYLPAGSTIVLIEPDDLQHHGQQFIERAERAEDYFSVATVLGHCQRSGLLSVAALARGRDEQMHRAPIESVERFSGDIGRVRQELDQAALGQQVFVVGETDAEVKRLSEILSSTQTGMDGRLQYVVGRLQAGFRLVGPDILVISGNELFHRATLKRAPRRRLSKAIESFLDLRNGDLVVHLAHGIGRYRGLKLLDKEGHVEEHLELEFHGGTRIYVPSAKIELVQKYVGARKIMPRLATIGGKNWLRQKKAAEAAVEDLAADLLQLQAEREGSPGIRFGRDTDWQMEFDAAFPYTETADQLTAIESIKGDMQAARPMDRLICGDVGFGKTELAMRAAFKAVDNGYQIAVLVPTTILAEQHYRTFVERMAEFPFSIAKLSRFCSAQEQRETIEALKTGAVDIVIGTHRLASKDVEFDNLGLLIIDEEQRFGVEVKERLKAIRSSIDVLTLSATPIPRTLHMSLTGIRDISNLETPPEDRVAVETRVTRWSHELIRNAILRELSREGQIYFVHNRVNDIEAVAKKLQYIVPEASIAIGHGQMREGELEAVMLDFVNGRHDILLATTIVESGLDIPNANTIFIDDANRYGLADLHQLRGRVGRYKHRAYCYLLVNPDKAVTPNAARRLRAIEEFSDMGAGFSIAMRDLEIRGAGNVLGTQQSGHIALVGYELYCQLLEAAVRRMKHLPQKLNAEVDIELPGQAFIPREYVPDMRIKIDLYRRLSRSVGDEAIEQMRQEFLDRFGPVPDEVQRLLTLARLKSEAAFWQITAIHLERPYMVFEYQDVGRAKQLVRHSNGRLRIVDDHSLYMTLPDRPADPDDLIELAIAVLRDSPHP